MDWFWLELFEDPPIINQFAGALFMLVAKDGWILREERSSYDTVTVIRKLKIPHGSIDDQHESSI